MIVRGLSFDCCALRDYTERRCLWEKPDSYLSHFVDSDIVHSSVFSTKISSCLIIYLSWSFSFSLSVSLFLSLALSLSAPLSLSPHLSLSLSPFLSLSLAVSFCLGHSFSFHHFLSIFLVVSIVLCFLLSRLPSLLFVPHPLPVLSSVRFPFNIKERQEKHLTKRPDDQRHPPQPSYERFPSEKSIASIAFRHLRRS